MLATLDIDGPIAEIVMRDPERRNALGTEMFDAIESSLRMVGARDDIVAVVLRGDGPAFCAGFDLAAANEDPQLMRAFILRLSAVIRSIRRLPMPVVAVVHGAALAGGCALISPCDLVVVADDAALGYPVHRIGVSPAVTSPTLMAAVGSGAARALLLSGDLIDGRTAQTIGLATHAAADAGAALVLGRRIAADLAIKGPRALRATKAWLNELDGSDDQLRFDRAAQTSAALADGVEAVEMLHRFWSSRRR